MKPSTVTIRRPAHFALRILLFSITHTNTLDSRRPQSQSTSISSQEYHNSCRKLAPLRERQMKLLNRCRSVEVLVRAIMLLRDTLYDHPRADGEEDTIASWVSFSVAFASSSRGVDEGLRGTYNSAAPSAALACVMARAGLKYSL